MEPHDDLYSTDADDSLSPPPQHSNPVPMNFSASFTFSQPISTQGTKKRKKRSEPGSDNAPPPVYQRTDPHSSLPSPLPPIQGPFTPEQWRSPLNVQYPYSQQIHYPNPFRLPEALSSLPPPMLMSNANISNVQALPMPISLSRHSTLVTNTSYSSGRWVLQEHPSGRQVIGTNKYFLICQLMSRFLSPNPIVIMQRESQPGEHLKEVVWGICTVSIGKQRFLITSSGKGRTIFKQRSLVLSRRSHKGIGS